MLNLPRTRKPLCWQIQKNLMGGLAHELLLTTRSTMLLEVWSWKQPWRDSSKLSGRSLELDAGGPLLEASEYSERHAVSAGQLFKTSACNLRKVHVIFELKLHAELKKYMQPITLCWGTFDAWWWLDSVAGNPAQLLAILMAADDFPGDSIVPWGYCFRLQLFEINSIFKL